MKFLKCVNLGDVFINDLFSNPFTVGASLVGALNTIDVDKFNMDNVDEFGAPTRDAPTVDGYGICNTSSVHRMGFSMMYSAIFSYARWSRMMCS